MALDAAQREQKREGFGMKKGKKFLRMTALVGCILLVGGILLTGAGYVGMGFSLKAFTLSLIHI